MQLAFPRFPAYYTALDKAGWWGLRLFAVLLLLFLLLLFCCCHCCCWSV
jgi:putative spermidine/putrescine transport system permease protein